MPSRACPMGYHCRLMTGYPNAQCPNARVCSVLQYSQPSVWDAEIEETTAQRQQRFYAIGYENALAMLGEGNNV